MDCRPCSHGLLQARPDRTYTQSSAVLPFVLSNKQHPFRESWVNFTPCLFRANSRLFRRKSLISEGKMDTCFLRFLTWCKTPTLLENPRIFHRFEELVPRNKQDLSSNRIYLFSEGIYTKWLKLFIIVLGG